MSTLSTERSLQESIDRVLAGRHHDPFAVLGCHPLDRAWQVRALLPGTAEAELVTGGESRPMHRLPDTDFFSCRLPG